MQLFAQNCSLLAVYKITVVVHQQFFIISYKSVDIKNRKKIIKQSEDKQVDPLIKYLNPMTYNKSNNKKIKLEDFKMLASESQSHLKATC